MSVEDIISIELVDPNRKDEPMAKSEMCKSWMDLAASTGVQAEALRQSLDTLKRTGKVTLTKAGLDNLIGEVLRIMLEALRRDGSLLIAVGELDRKIQELSE